MLPEGPSHPHLRRRPARLLRIKGEHLAHQHRLRPAIQDQMVVGPQKPPAVLRQPNQRQAHQRRRLGIEALAAIALAPRLEPRPLFFGAGVAPVLLDPGQLDLAVHHLQRVLQLLPVERGAQHRMPRGQPLPGPAQRVGVERPRQLTGDLQQVGPSEAHSGQAVEQHALLGGREAVDRLGTATAHASGPSGSIGSAACPGSSGPPRRRGSRRA